MFSRVSVFHRLTVLVAIIAASIIKVEHAESFVVARSLIVNRTPFTVTTTSDSSSTRLSESKNSNNPFDVVAGVVGRVSDQLAVSRRGGNRMTRAKGLMTSLVEADKCFTTVSGAKAFADSCSVSIVFEDCFEPQPIVGRTAVEKYLVANALARKGGGFRLDRISDGNRACGFAWTWTSGGEEGLRGTTFVELNDNGEIQYVRTIPEPIYKPGDITLELLKALTADAEKTDPKPFVERTPRDACDVAKYLFEEVQGQSVQASMKLFSENIVYRDFNYEDLMTGKAEVQKFIENFSFPGIEFRPQRYDDGVISTCFTWEVALMDGPDTVKGISFYELDPETRLITYVRDVPESAIKPPILGKLARQLRPELGVFKGVKLGGRPGGM